LLSRQGQDATLEIHVFPSQGELFQLAHTTQDREPNPGSIGGAEPLANPRFFLRRKIPRLAGRFLEHLDSADWIAGELPISDGFVQNPPQELQVGVYCPHCASFYQLRESLFQRGWRQRRGILPKGRKLD
jgi:hypothetical protein